MTHPLEAENRRLREALAALLHAVCGETGFANAVRTDAGKAYPWEGLDIAEEKARAALAAEPASGEAKCEIDREHHWRYRLNGTIDPCLYCGINAPSAPPPPPTQGEEAVELACRIIWPAWDKIGKESKPMWRDVVRRALVAALRQRADEATRAENEACAELARDAITSPGLAGEIYIATKIETAIRARINPATSADSSQSTS